MIILKNMSGPLIFFVKDRVNNIMLKSLTVFCILLDVKSLIY